MPKRASRRNVNRFDTSSLLPESIALRWSNSGIRMKLLRQDTFRWRHRHPGECNLSPERSAHHLLPFGLLLRIQDRLHRLLILGGQSPSLSSCSSVSSAPGSFWSQQVRGPSNCNAICLRRANCFSDSISANSFSIPMPGGSGLVAVFEEFVIGGMCSIIAPLSLASSARIRCF